MSRDGQPDKAPVPNHALAARMREKGFSEGRLATAAGVDIKTVGRWVRGESLPQAVNARAAADALGCDPQALWPDLFPIMRPPGTGTVAVSVYGSRADVPVTVWTELFGGALEAIDILVYGGTFLFDGVPDSASCSLPPPNAAWQSGSSSATPTQTRSPSAASRRRSAPTLPGAAG